jgi:DNA polymerase-3 subunit gamma/tau
MGFDEVIGQEHVTTTLKNALQSNRVAHAYLFTGPHGVGKTTAARILAKALNCAAFDQPTDAPCGKCSVCREVADSRSVDVLEIDGASNRGIDQIRELRENVKYAPAAGRFKVYIIDEVHMLTEEAFNALLKTLEEPPRHVVFIFATTEVNRVPATILSRCQRFDFRRIGVRQIQDHLQKIAQAEGVSLSQDAARVIARKVHGSLRDAESILDQLVSYSGTQVEVDDVRTVFGFLSSAVFFDLVDRLLSGDSSGVLAVLEEVNSKGVEMSELMIGLLEHLRLVLLIQLGVQTDDVAGLTEEERQEYQSQGARTDVGQLLRMIRMIEDAERSLRWSGNPRCRVETTLLRLCHLDSTVTIDQILERLSQLGNSEEIDQQSPALHAPEAHSEEPQSVGSLSLYRLEQLWPTLVERVRQNRMALASFLETGHPLRLENGVLVIRFSDGNHFVLEQMQCKENQVLMERELADLLGTQVRIRCETGDLAAGKGRREPRASPSVTRKKKVPPIVDAARKILDAEIVPDG